MCIRDRVGMLPNQRQRSLIKTTLVGEEKVGQPIITQNRHAVSYTHLRAHETVLDLVCRLLLETKNKHKIYQDH